MHFLQPGLNTSELMGRLVVWYTWYTIHFGINGSPGCLVHYTAVVRYGNGVLASWLNFVLKLNFILTNCQVPDCLLSSGGVVQKTQPTSGPPDTTYICKVNSNTRATIVIITFYCSHPVFAETALLVHR